MGTSRFTAIVIRTSRFTAAVMDTSRLTVRSHVQSPSEIKSTVARHDQYSGVVAGLVMNSTLVSSTLNSALSLNVTVTNTSRSSRTSGAQLTNYSLTTAVVDDNTVVLSGDPDTFRMKGVTCIHFCFAQAIHFRAQPACVTVIALVDGALQMSLSLYMTLW